MEYEAQASHKENEKIIGNYSDFKKQIMPNNF